MELSICQMFPSLNPLTLYEYPFDDVISLVGQVIKKQGREEKSTNNKGETITRHGKDVIIRKPAGDNWF